MLEEVELKVKEEIQRLLKVKFIRPARYVEQLSNVIHMVKKIKKLRVCVDFRNLNSATLKDKYLMLIVDMLINEATRH